MKRKKSILRRLIKRLLSVALIFCIIRGSFEIYTVFKEIQLAHEAAQIYTTEKKEATGLREYRPPQPSPAPEPAPTVAEENEPEPITPEPRELIVKPELEALRAQYSNEDIIGFLSVEGTTINYPVLQYTDNDFYLSKNIYKENNSAGSIFLDYENNIENLDMNTVIYGHNMKNDIMFHGLRNYKDFSFWENHKYIHFNTIYDDMVFEIFAYYTPADSYPYIYANYEDNVFFNLLAQIKEMAYYDTGIGVNTTDKIIHLSTCTNTTNNTRMAVVGKLIELNGEEFQHSSR